MNKKSYFLKKEKEIKNINTDIIKYIKVANNCIVNNDYDMALQVFMSAKNITSNPIFDYFIGKVYYLMEKYNYAKIYFKKYEKIGGILLLECKIYLLLIILNSNDKQTPYIDNLKEIYRMLSYNNEQDNDEFNDINYLFSLVDNDANKVYNLINSKTEV